MLLLLTTSVFAAVDVPLELFSREWFSVNAVSVTAAGISVVSAMISVVVAVTSYIQRKDFNDRDRADRAASSFDDLIKDASRDLKREMRNVTTLLDSFRSNKDNFKEEILGLGEDLYSQVLDFSGEVELLIQGMESTDVCELWEGAGGPAATIRDLSTKLDVFRSGLMADANHSLASLEDALSASQVAQTAFKAWVTTARETVRIHAIK